MDSTVASKKVKNPQGIKKKYDSSNNKSVYSSKSLPYDKRNIAMNTQSQVTKFRKTYKDISPDAQMIVDQIIDPEMQNNVSLLPSYGVGCSYTAHNILDAAYSTSGEAIVIAYPSLRDSIFYTSGTNIVQTITVPGGNLNPYLSQFVSIRNNTSVVPFTTPFYFANNHVVLSQPFANIGFLYGIRPSTAGTSTLEIHCTIADNHNTTALRFNVTAYNSAAAVLHTVAAPFSAGVAAVTLFDGSISPSTMIEWMSFTISVVGGAVIPFDTEMSLQIILGGAGTFPTINLPNVPSHCLVQQINESDTLHNSAESYFISAQSLLLTYEGSTIRDSGRMSIARVPAASWAGQLGGQAPLPSVSSYYSWISSLARNSYNGAARHGGYAFYLGEDEQNYFYRPVQQAQEQELPYLIAAFSTDVAEPQAMRIMVTTIVQFTTNSNIYNQSPSPYLGEDWCKLLHILSCINAAYDNGGHREKLKAALKKVGGKVLNLLKDPKTYATVGSIIAGLL